MNALRTVNGTMQLGGAGAGHTLLFRTPSGSLINTSPAAASQIGATHLVLGNQRFLRPNQQIPQVHLQNQINLQNHLAALAALAQSQPNLFVQSNASGQAQGSPTFLNMTAASTRPASLNSNAAQLTLPQGYT